MRPQVGGFATLAEAQKALRKALDRLGPGRGGAMTLAELVDEYLELHQAEPVTIAKLRWLLGKATSALGGKRTADLSPKDVYAWRLTVPEGHRFEATQALRQVLNRAVAWGLLDFNPARRGVPNPQRRPNEKRPFESWAQIEAIAARLGPVYGPMVIFGAATGLRPSELFGLEQHDLDREAGVVYVRRAFANGRSRTPRPGSARARFGCKRKRLRRSTGCRPRSTRSSSRTRVAAGSTSASSAAATGDQLRSPLASSRSAVSTTSATPTRPSGSAPAFRCSRSRASSVRASR